jgi:hypothetical protein
VDLRGGFDAAFENAMDIDSEDEEALILLLLDDELATHATVRTHRRYRKPLPVVFTRWTMD